MHAIAHCDIPVLFSGTIPMKYLQAAPNCYEAGIRGDMVEHINDITLTSQAPLATFMTPSLKEDLKSFKHLNFTLIDTTGLTFKILDE
jgi:hypothetical protein